MASGWLGFSSSFRPVRRLQKGHRTPFFASKLLAETTALVVDEPLYTRQEVSLETLHVVLIIHVRHDATEPLGTKIAMSNVMLGFAPV